VAIDSRACKTHWKLPYAPSDASHLEFLEDGRLLRRGDARSTVWDLAKGSVVPFTADRSRRPSVDRKPDKSWVFVDAEGASHVIPLQTKEQYIFQQAVSADGSLLAVGIENDVEVWNTRAPKLVRRVTMKGRLSRVEAKGRWLFASDNKEAVVWDFATGKEALRIAVSRFSPYPHWSGDGRVMFLHAQQTCGVWDVERGAQLFTFDPGALAEVQLAHSGKYLVTGTSDGTLTARATADGKVLRTWRLVRSVNMHGVSAAIHPTAPLVAVHPDDRTVFLYRLDDEKPPISLVVDATREAGIAFTPDAVQLVGDPARARHMPRCRLGPRSYPFDVCSVQVTNNELLSAAIRP
jgi:WD40 repeat protein